MLLIKHQIQYAIDAHRRGKFSSLLVCLFIEYNKKLQLSYVLDNVLKDL